VIIILKLLMAKDGISMDNAYIAIQNISDMRELDEARGNRGLEVKGMGKVI